jgi:hypothetical protein
MHGKCLRVTLQATRILCIDVLPFDRIRCRKLQDEYPVRSADPSLKLSEAYKLEAPSLEVALSPCSHPYLLARLIHECHFLAWKCAGGRWMRSEIKGLHTLEKLCVPRGQTLGRQKHPGNGSHECALQGPEAMSAIVQGFETLAITGSLEQFQAAKDAQAVPASRPSRATLGPILRRRALSSVYRPCLRSIGRSNRFSGEME